MKVTLAYPIDDHEPDETIDVDDDRGRTLLRDGFARPADTDSRVATRDLAGVGTEPPPNSGAGSGRDAWATYAEKVGVGVDSDMTREQIIEAVHAAQSEKE